MNIKDKRIDGGNAFDWGRASKEYAKFRDIYPEEFYERIAERNLCVKGQSVLDIGTGTGVIPRNMYKFGAAWSAADISENQINEAKKLSVGMDINYFTASDEELSFPDNSFDVITACQCFWYLHHEALAKKLFKMLNPGGSFLVMCMEWLPFESEIANESEKLVLKYSPSWSGAGETMHKIDIPKCYEEYFGLTYHDEYKLNVHFTRSGWNGRMKACRGIGASLPPEKIKEWEMEHTDMLSRLAPEEFDILHYAAIAQLKKKDMVK